MDDIIRREKTGYSSHLLTEVVDEKHMIGSWSQDTGWVSDYITNKNKGIEVKTDNN